MTQDELLKLGFIDQTQYEAARKALETNAQSYGAMGFSAENWNPVPLKGADYSRPCYVNSPEYPSEVDLTTEMPPVYNQGARGTCMANAVVALVEYYYENKEKLSRQFFYWAMKNEDGCEARLRKWCNNYYSDETFVRRLNNYLKQITTVLFNNQNNAEVIDECLTLLKKDSNGKFVLNDRAINIIVQQHRDCFSGASFETAFKTLRKYGICRDELMEYCSYEKFESEAQALSMDRELEEEFMRDKLLDAKERIPDNLQMVPGSSIDAYKRILNGAGGKRPMPLVFAVQTFRSLHSEYTNNTGWFSLPFADDKPSGGHAMLAVGYKDTPVVPGGGYLIVRNSWGADWAWSYKDDAHRGYARIPYAYVEKFAYSAAMTIIADSVRSGGAGDGWPPKKDKMAKYIKVAPRMMKNRKGLFNIGKGESIIVDPVTDKADKDTPENRKIFIMNGYSWDPPANNEE